jgi:hypothetical protein
MVKNISCRDFLIVFAFVVCFDGCSKRDAMDDAMSKLPHFDVNAAPPSCGRWREHMPAARAKEPYDIYINARKRWRSKQAWLFGKEENKSILNDVIFAAEKGDWGAKALLATFYRQGLGYWTPIMSLIQTRRSRLP